ncbi:MAG: ATP-binding cassette domain-containing protein [Lachnospiraceae bacterium]|nr:ATP-binding cassette domain-containing protein [Lachnospiraceae bacterium]
MAETILYSELSNKGAVLALFDHSGFAGIYPLGPLTTIGRASSGSNCDIPVNSRLVSRNHAKIVFADSEYRYIDSGSTNGTQINGVHIGNGPDESKSAILKNGDILKFYRHGSSSEEDRVTAVFSTVLDSKTSWKVLPLYDTAEILVGRSNAAGVKIENNMISEKHASFFKAHAGWAIIDHNSKNGVFRNGKRVTSPGYLEVQDVIRVADSYFIFLGDRLLVPAEMNSTAPAGGTLEQSAEKDRPAPVREAPIHTPEIHHPAPAGETPVQNPATGRQTPVEETPKPRRKQRDEGDLVIHITERSVVKRFEKLLLLQDINLTISSGEMVLILGGSGAGKTTFMNAVMGYEKATGSILYRDTDIYEEYESMKYEIGFVPQQDLLRGSDTVYDTIENAAQMKLPKRMSHVVREEKITKVLEELGLSRERDSLVSKLSGGQKKRLSIAVELIANPSLFFLDEPDSGVDDIMGRGLMENLRHIADSGKIVMMISHSPERAADLFDKVLVLAKSTVDNCGHMAFFGTPDEAFKFFGVTVFRDIVRKINRPDENGEGMSDYFIEKYRKMTEGGEIHE